MLDKSRKSAKLNVSNEEVTRFDALAESWWDPNGQYKTALAFNQARLNIIKSIIDRHFGINHSTDGYNTLSIVDIGSGGGLISEPLAQLGAQVMGIDASAVSVEVATRHAEKQNINVDYRHMLSNEMVAEGKQFDVVINAEVVEHVPDQQGLIEDCKALVAPGGLLVLATLNKTLKSFVIAIVGAEYVMRYLPVGTHDWKKFVTPQTLNYWVGDEFSLCHEEGLKLNPLSGKWKPTSSLAVNYIQAYARKR